MRFPSKRKTLLVVVTLLLSSFALGAVAQSKMRKSDDIYHDLEIFARIIERVRSHYVDEVDTHELIEKAIDAMLEELDPHSQFLDGDDYEDLMVSTRGEFGGLGILITIRDNYPTVISPIDDTPGERAGLRGGDQIVEIEGMSTEGWRSDKAVKYLRGEPGSNVSFKVSRPGGDEAVDYVITREKINVKSVPYYGMFDDEVGYIKVSNFAKRTAREVSDAVADLESQGMKSLVLDFRSNPGGLLTTAHEVTEQFLGKDKLVVYTKGRLNGSNRKFYSSNNTPHNGYPIVVMINGASASASEIFAGALQDWDAALVVGQTSFGKGTVQTVFNLSESEAVKLTTAKYYTPSGRSIHKDVRDDEPEQLAVTDGDEDSGQAALDAQQLFAEEGEKLKERPMFYTSQGRVVYGGGGIAPDVEFESRTYTDLQRRLERDGMFFTFAVEYLKDHADDRNFRASDKNIAEFRKFLNERDFEIKDGEWNDENIDYVRTMIARDVVASKYGRRSTYSLLLEQDSEFQEVLRLIREHKTLQGLYKYAEQQNAIKKAEAEAKTGTDAN